MSVRLGRRSWQALRMRSGRRRKYSARMSGPLSDRIDMHVPVGAVALRDLNAPATGDDSTTVRKRSRVRARCRLRATDGTGRRLQRARTRPMARSAHRSRGGRTGVPADRCGSLELSARGYHRVIKVARTIADLEGDTVLRTAHMAEALRYRAPREAR